MFALAGFRYDYWQTSWKHPVDTALGVHGPNDTAFVTVNSYIPLVGLLSKRGRLTFGVVGFPFVFGDVEHKENYSLGQTFVRITGGFNSGYFFELFGEYGLPMPGFTGSSEFDLSLFGKYNAMEAKSDAKIAVTGFADETWDFVFRRQLFVVGAKATLNFNLAGILPF